VTATPVTDLSPVPSKGDLGRAIRRLRIERDLTVDGLAHIAPIHPTNLSRIELGYGNPTWRKLVGIAKGLEIPISTMIHEAEVEAQIAAGIRSVRSELGLPAESRITTNGQFS
jgi:transcriptional regulator with XRE-family HTH domain